MNNAEVWHQRILNLTNLEKDNNKLVKLWFKRRQKELEEREYEALTNQSEAEKIRKH